MSFRRAARAALSCPTSSNRSVIFKPALAPVVLKSVLNFVLILVLFLALFCISCNNSNQSSPGPGPDHTAYVTLPSQGAVAQLSIQVSTGFITVQATSPITAGVTPTGLALTPSRKFLYVVNSRANTVSTFNVASDGSLSLTAATTNTDSSPNSAVIDPSGQYLLVTNSFSDDVSVFAIDASSGALSEVAGSPFYANTTPTQIAITHSGEFVYVTNPSIGMVTGFSFSGGVLTQLPTSPILSGAGAGALTVDAGDQFLYVANPSASNAPPNQSTNGNISGFAINSSSGELTLIAGSPFTSAEGPNGPTAIIVDPSGRFVYAVSEGTSSSIWCFTITSNTGQLTAVANSPFSLAAGGLFALVDPIGNYFYMGSQTGKGIDGYTYNSSTGALTLLSGSPFLVGAPGRMVLSE